MLRCAVVDGARRSHAHTSGHSDRGPRAWGSGECARCVEQQQQTIKMYRYAFMPPFDRACPARVAKLAGRSFTIGCASRANFGRGQLVEDITVQQELSCVNCFKTQLFPK